MREIGRPGCFLAGLARRFDRRGVSVIEIVIATLILGFVSVGMVEFFAKGRIWFDQEEHKRVATLLAQEALERTVSQSYDQVVNWTETRNVSAVRYSISVSVQSDVPEPAIKTIQSVVTWPATTTVQRSVRLSTMLCDL